MTIRLKSDIPDDLVEYKFSRNTHYVVDDYTNGVMWPLTLMAAGVCFLAIYFLL